MTLKCYYSQLLVLKPASDIKLVHDITAAKDGEQGRIMLEIISIPKDIRTKFSLIKEVIEKDFKQSNVESLENGIKPRLKPQEKLIEDMLDFVEIIIDPQIKDHFVLDLSDKRVSEKMGVNKRRAKQIRLELRRLNIIFFPEHSRPKKKGDYPMWMVRSKYIEFNEEKFEKRIVKNSKYIASYENIKKEARRRAYEILEENGYVTGAVWGIVVEQEIKAVLRDMKKTKEDFLK